MSSRRDALSGINLNINERPNAGLWLDKYIADLSKDDKESRSALAKEVTRINEPYNYEAIYNTWKETLENQLNADCRKAKVQSRMTVGLGSDGVLETSVMLHRTYGVPYIPGTALKGLAAAFARHYCGDDWQQGKPFYEIVFGTQVEAGYVTFFDALYVPNSGHNKKALHFDIMTVHHRDYYEGKNRPPADWDDPNPIPFISATGEYLIALAAPEGCEAWRKVAYKILEEALRHEGVGAKTSSGYGRLEIEKAPVDADESLADAMIRAINSIPQNKLPSELGQKAGDLISSPIKGQHKKRVAELIDKRAAELGNKQRRKFEEKSWFTPIQIMLKE